MQSPGRQVRRKKQKYFRNHNERKNDKSQTLMIITPPHKIDVDIHIFDGKCVIQSKPNTKVHDELQIALDETSFSSIQVENLIIQISKNL